MTDSKMREAFENWAKAECLDLDSIDGFYSDNDTHIAWGAWLAAQAAQSVPVMGEVWRWAINKADGTPLLFVCSQADADKYRSRSDLEVFPVYRQPTHSISADELERLRKDAERYRWLKESSHYYIGETYDCDCCGTAEDFTSYCDQNDSGLDAHIDAAIAAEVEK